MKKCVTLVKETQRALNATKFREQLEHVRKRALAGQRVSRGWEAQYNEPRIIQTTLPSEENPQEQVAAFRYEVDLVVSCSFKRSRKADVMDKEWKHLLDVVETAAGSRNWSVSGVADQGSAQEEDFAQAILFANTAEIPVHTREEAQDEESDVVAEVSPETATA